MNAARTPRRFAANPLGIDPLSPLRVNMQRHGKEIRFRLISCHTCGWRSWITDVEPTPEHQHADLWEDYTFFAADNGAGLAPTQL